jgi:hypothetical protein
MTLGMRPFTESDLAARPASRPASDLVAPPTARRHRSRSVAHRLSRAIVRADLRQRSKKSYGVNVKT